MIEAIIAIIMALISFFTSKKAGASDGEAAAIAGAAGLGTYYVGTQTEWGRNAVSNIESWLGLTEGGKPVLNADGKQVKLPKGAEVVRNENGEIARDSNGNVMWKLVDSTGKVLTSWGAAGTMGVIGATGVATGKINPWWIALGGAAVLIILAR